MPKSILEADGLEELARAGQLMAYRHEDFWRVPVARPALADVVGENAESNVVARVASPRIGRDGDAWLTAWSFAYSTRTTPASR